MSLLHWNQFNSPQVNWRSFLGTVSGSLAIVSISLNRISIPFRVKGPQDIPSFLYLIHRHNQSRCNYLSERSAGRIDVHQDWAARMCNKYCFVIVPTSRQFHEKHLRADCKRLLQYCWIARNHWHALFVHVGLGVRFLSCWNVKFIQYRNN